MTDSVDTLNKDLATLLLIEHCEQHSANLSMEPTPFQLEQAVNFLVATVPAWARRVEAELSRLREQRDAENTEKAEWYSKALAAQQDAEAAEARCVELQNEVDRWRGGYAPELEELARLQQALERIAKGYHLEDHDYTGACNGRCAQKMAREALAGPDTPDALAAALRAVREGK